MNLHPDVPMGGVGVEAFDVLVDPGEALVAREVRLGVAGEAVATSARPGMRALRI